MLKKNVLRNKKDFDAIYRKGKSVPDRYVVVIFKKNSLPYSRTCFLASKKVGNSVQRNRARRLMKEGMRASGMILPDGYDFIIIARKSICSVKCRDVQRSLKSAFRRTGVIGK
jgi:ribonuclease P protein component